MADVIEIFPDGTQIERSFTEEEKTQIELDRLLAEQLEADKIAKHEARIAAVEKLKSLGLSEFELLALGITVADESTVSE